MSLDAAVRHFLHLWDRGEEVGDAVKRLRQTLPEVDLYRAIYTSRSLLKPHEDAQLLEQCVQNNAASDITGVLMRESTHYIQIIEGHKPKVMQLLEKIKADQRHTDFLLIRADSVSERIFSGWSMGSQLITPEEYKMWAATFEAGQRYVDKLVNNFFDGRYRK